MGGKLEWKTNKEIWTKNGTKLTHNKGVANIEKYVIRMNIVLQG